MPQAETVALPKRLPLVLEPSNRADSTDKDAKLVNGYMERGSSEGEYWVYKRPGLGLHSTFTTAAGSGVYNWQGDIYAIFGATLYKNGTSIGVVDSTGGVYRFTSSLGATPRLQLGNGVKAYNWDGATLAEISPLDTVTAGAFVVGVEYTILTVGTTDFTLIGAASNTVGVVFTATGVGAGTGTATAKNNFPSPFVKGWAYLDGTTYVMDAKAFIHGSDTVPGMNAPEQWTDLLNTLGAQIEPDGGVALAKQLVYVLALKQWSTEVFYDAANPVGSLPLAPVQGAKINYGCVSADSVQEIDGTLFWLATNRSSAVQVLQVDNLKATVVSTKPVERLLSDADFSVVYSFSIKFEGHRFYVFTLKNSNLTLVYDMTDRLWAQWTDADGNYFKIVSSTYVSGTGRLLQHETNGKLYHLDSTYTSDDGALITVDLYTPNFDGGVRRRKQLNFMEFICDQTAGSSLQVRVNDMDFAEDAWSTFRDVDLSVERAFLQNCGTFRRRATHIRHKCDTRMRLQAIELQLDLGTL